MQGYCVGTIIEYNGNKTTHLIVKMFRLEPLACSKTEISKSCLMSQSFWL